MVSKAEGFRESLNILQELGELGSPSARSRVRTNPLLTWGLQLGLLSFLLPFIQRFYTQVHLKYNSLQKHGNMSCVISRLMLGVQWLDNLYTFS